MFRVVGFRVFKASGFAQSTLGLCKGLFRAAGFRGKGIVY